MALRVSISIAVDGLREYGARFGLSPEALEYKDDEIDPIYGRAWPHSMAMLARHGLSATFFVTGRCLETPVPTALAREAFHSGHEIANRSYSAHTFFAELPAAKREEEIIRGEEAIVAALGVRPTGFCAPNFQLHTDVLRVLSARGYQYDASVLPLPTVLSLQPLASSLLRKIGVDTGAYLGSSLGGVAPHTPYHPSQNSYMARGEGSLWEIPVSAVPLLRAPLLGEALLRIGKSSARVLRDLVKKQPFLHFSLHAADFLEENDISPALRAACPALARPEAERQEILEEVIASLCEGAEVCTLQEAAKRF